MILRLDVPATDASLRSGRVTRWHKKEGDIFAFGDVICEIYVDNFAVLRRTARATLLSRRRRKLRDDLEHRQGKVGLDLTVTAADDGVLRRILVEAGDEATVGETIAVVSTSEDDELDGSEADWREAPQMRATSNIINHENYITEEDA